MFAFVPSALIMVINPRSFGKLNSTWEFVRAVNIDGLRCSAISELCRTVPPFPTAHFGIMLKEVRRFPSLCLLDCCPSSAAAVLTGSPWAPRTSHRWALRVANCSPRLEPFYSEKITSKPALFPICPVLGQITHLGLLF